ncbi:Putative epoxidase LasC [Coccomyxa sp. Obi]|nr:Putative epoxidase LasC [Coccomyxa sp. Obi]
MIPRDLEALSAKRGGVPQFQQPHVMLVGGLRLCEELFSGFTESLRQAGGQPVDWLKDCKAYDFGVYMDPLPQSEESPLGSVGATRKLMEHTARNILLTRPNMSLQCGSLVTGLRFSDDNSTVLGVVLKDGNEISADIVVDASGRNSKVSEWLEAAGCSAPPQQVINSGLGYGTRTYKMPEDWRLKHGWNSFLISPRPGTGRQGLLLPVEHDRWQVILTGLAGDHPPTDEEGYLEFARSLPQKDIYEAIKQAEPIGPVYTYSRTENVRRHYEKVDLPAGVCILGDAATCFNPVYGQGMTVGIKGAILLRDLLQKRLGPGVKFSSEQSKAVLKGFGKEFQTELAALQDFPWTVATGDDEKHLQAAGKLPPKKKSVGETIINWYFLQAIRCAMHDYNVRARFFSVNHMMVPPTAMFHPSIASKVALISIKDAWGALTSA